MTKIAAAIAAVGLALVASTPAFANRAGGPDTQNPVPHVPAFASAANTVQVLGGRGERLVEPTVTAEALTGSTSDLIATYHVGRIIYRLIRVHQSGDRPLAKDEYILFHNG